MGRGAQSWLLAQGSHGCGYQCTWESTYNGSCDWEGSPPGYMYPPPNGNVLVASQKEKRMKDKEKKRTKQCKKRLAQKKCRVWQTEKQ